MKISDTFQLWESLGDRSSLPIEKEIEISILELAVKPAFYGLINVAVYFMVILLPFGIAIDIIVAMISAAIAAYMLKSFLAESKNLKAQAISRVSETSWDASEPQEFLVDLQADNLFNRGFAQILSLSKLALIFVTVLAGLITAFGLGFFPPLMSVIVLPLWGYISVSVIYDADQTVWEDFDTSSKGATGKLYNVDTSTLTGVNRIP